MIMSLGAVVAYIVGEGLVDSAGAGATTINNNFPDSTSVTLAAKSKDIELENTDAV